MCLPYTWTRDMLQNWVATGALRLSMQQRTCHGPVYCFPIWTAPSLERRDVHASLRRHGMIKWQQQPGRVGHLKNLFCMGKFALYLIPLFHWKRKSASFQPLRVTSFVGTNPYYSPPILEPFPSSKLPAQGPTSRALSRAAHIRRVLLGPQEGPD